MIEDKLLGVYGLPFACRISEKNRHNVSQTASALPVSNMSDGGASLPDSFLLSAHSVKVLIAHCIDFSVFCGTTFFLDDSNSD